MTDEVNGGGSPPVTPAPHSARRSWRALHRPVVRRSDPLLDLVGTILTWASTLMLVAGYARARNGRSLPDVNALIIVVCAVTIIGAVSAMIVYLVVRRAASPLAGTRVLWIVAVSVLSPILLWALNRGVMTPLIVAAGIANALCLTVSVSAWAGLRLWDRHRNRN